MKKTARYLSALMILISIGLISTTWVRAEVECATCKYSVISIPEYPIIKVNVTLPTEVGPIRYIVVDQVVPTPRFLWHFCICLDAEGHSGVNDPPEERWCQYFTSWNDFPEPGTQGILEQEFCSWRDGYVQEGHCINGGTAGRCPDM